MKKTCNLPTVNKELTLNINKLVSKTNISKGDAILLLRETTKHDEVIELIVYFYKRVTINRLIKMVQDFETMDLLEVLETIYEEINPNRWERQ